MIAALWHRWINQGQWWWLVVLAAALLADVLVGSWLIARELELLKAMTR